MQGTNGIYIYVAAMANTHTRQNCTYNIGYIIWNGYWKMFNDSHFWITGTAQFSTQTSYIRMLRARHIWASHLSTSTYVCMPCMWCFVCGTTRPSHGMKRCSGLLCNIQRCADRKREDAQKWLWLSVFYKLFKRMKRETIRTYIPYMYTYGTTYWYITYIYIV